MSEEMVTMSSGQGQSKKTKSVPLTQITHFISDMKYVEAHYPGGMLILSVSLSELAAKHTGRFIRCHRKALVSKRHMQRIEACDHRSGALFLEGVEGSIPVSRRHKREVINVLKEIRGD